MAKVNFGAFLSAFKAKGDKVKRRAKTEYHVLFKAAYAVFVHERTDLHHDNGQAKFLEEPLRTEAATMTRLMNSVLKSNGDLDTAVAVAAQYLLSVAKSLVPVKTGFLRDSGEVRRVK